MISYRKLAMRVLGHSPVSAVKTARRSTGKRAAALALTAALVVGMTLPAFADVYDLTKGDISVGFKNNQQTVTQEDGKGGYVKNKYNEDIIDLPDNDVTITTKDAGTGEVKTTDNTITINSNEGQTTEVTLDNVNINTSRAAVSVTGSGNTNIELNGNNTLTSGGWQAGLEHNKEKDSNRNETSGTLTITDTDKNGSLTANGSSGGAGIGGANFKDAGKLEITGGTINATMVVQVLVAVTKAVTRISLFLAEPSLPLAAATRDRVLLAALASAEVVGAVMPQLPLLVTPLSKRRSAANSLLASVAAFKAKSA